MYTVKIKNIDSITIINDDSGILSRQISKGVIKDEINKISSFSFEIYPDNKGYDQLIPFATSITVYDEIHNKTVFEGRVLTIDPSMDSSGMVVKSVVCESRLGYLNDTVQDYAAEKNWTTASLLGHILDVHNARTTTDKKILLGTVYPVDNNDNLYCGIQYDKTWQVINDKLLVNGGEIRLRNVNGILYLDYGPSWGDDSDLQIKLAKNMQSITQKIDSSALITRFYPMGAKIKTKDTDGNEQETDQRISIVTNTQTNAYIDDAAYINTYGVIEAFDTWDDVHDPVILKTKGEEWLAANNRIATSYEVELIDLSLIDSQEAQLIIGNKYAVQNDLIGVKENLRITSIEIDCSDPASSKITFGDKRNTLTQAQTSIQGYVNEVLTKEIKVNQEVTAANIENTRQYAATITENARQLTITYIDSQNAKQDENIATLQIEADAIKSEVSSVHSYTGPFSMVTSRNNSIITKDGKKLRVSNGDIFHYLRQLKSEEKSSIEQTAQSIRLEVYANYETKDSASGNYQALKSEIDQTADKITLQVRKDEIRKDFAESTESSITISSGVIDFATGGLMKFVAGTLYIDTPSFKLDTNNELTINTANFKLTSDGSLTCSNATISGTITGSVVNGATINASNLNLLEQYADAPAGGMIGTDSGTINLRAYYPGNFDYNGKVRTNYDPGAKRVALSLNNVGLILSDTSAGGSFLVSSYKEFSIDLGQTTFHVSTTAGSIRMSAPNGVFVNGVRIGG